MFTENGLSAAYAVGAQLNSHPIAKQLFSVLRTLSCFDLVLLNTEGLQKTIRGL